MSTKLSLPVLPLDDTVVLPTMVVPLDISSSEARASIEAAQMSAEAPESNENGPQVLLVPRLGGKYAPVGTLAAVEQVGRLPSGEHAAVVRGLSRVRIGTGTTGPGAALWVEGTVLEEPPGGPRAQELGREYRGLAATILQKRGAWQLVDVLQRLTDPSALADSAGYAGYLSLEQRNELLETVAPDPQLEKLVGWARDHIAELDVAETIQNDVREGMEKQQREFLLRQQLAAIRKELGELNGEPDTEEQDYQARIEAADLPEKVAEAAQKEAAKLERTSDGSPEAGWIRTWLDTVLEIPWNSRTDDAYDIAAARAILDADHAGLDDVKDRIIEYLAVRKRRADKGLALVGGRRSGAVLALTGPPGVGKTSLGESVARAMGRKFARVSLGGVRDEAEIRGHPTAALLEVLDPAQNHTFRDHYLEVELDLSDVLFIATANIAEAIPEPLIDRMEPISLDGYTEDEKVTIARGHLLPRQLERAGLDAADVDLTDDALRRLATEYTREAGVRALERSIARVLRKIAARLASSEAELPVTVGADDLHGYIGHPRFTPESAERTAVPGVATGLAVTGTGGDVLFIEASLADKETGDTGVRLTGQLGDVMKESAQIALSYLRSHGAELELPVGTLKDRGVHVHVPAGAVPKDGPSAGVTMTTALASLLSGRLVRSDVAMTGEVSLTGRVLPIGGVKQKLLAAQRAGITTVLIPKRNEPDLEDVPEGVREQLEIHPVSDVREVLELALEPATVQAPVAA